MCRSQKENLTFIGAKFRRFFPYKSKITSDAEIGQELIEQCILIHCENAFPEHIQKSNESKFNLLCLAVRKLYMFVEGKIIAQAMDVGTDCHEVVTAGHILASILRNGFKEYLRSVQLSCLRYFNKCKNHSSNGRCTVEFSSYKVFENIINPQKIMNGCIAERLAYFVNTGNLPFADRTWKQKSGWSITADRINYFRFLSHFRAVHRGSFWTQMRTTSVRKLRPEAWGFLCPVHTPDGAPCGLLNHLAEPAKVLTHYYFDSQRYHGFLQVLFSMGVLGLCDVSSTEIPVDDVPVLLNGVFIGYIAGVNANGFVDNLRLFKIRGKHGIPRTLSIAAVFDAQLKIWPEISLSTLPARIIRPVKHLQTQKIEWISAMEQIFMDIAVVENDIHHRTTHIELSPQSILSVLAGCTPFSDNNQSPRNMYQCQMLKQAMGLSAMNMDFRCDNKAYRLQNAQRPVVENDMYRKYELNDYSSGTNAVVAVISYTGYDMEDAMIICKQSMQRGFKHGSVCTTEVIDMNRHRGNFNEMPIHLNNIEANGLKHFPDCDAFGLPTVGTRLEKNDVLYVTYNDLQQAFILHRYKKEEPSVVEQIRCLDGHRNKNGTHEPLLVTIKLRYDRRPIIGDKFASRAGQKGTLAQLWPAEDMPFTENGIVPDLIINPHAFPSRMTIGMLLESNASKAGAILGRFFDSSPFKFDENERAVDFFGRHLRSQGYNYYGSESMYCGTTGTAMQADIYIGIVFYQRLRHMISDKYQVRAMGPVNSLTSQPLKGRKRKGGIRFGEMERDSMISHGCAYLLHDRLFECSDGEVRWICIKCGSHLGVFQNPSTKRQYCSVCKSDQNLARVNLPHVYCYLTNELAAMNVKLTLKVEAE